MASRLLRLPRTLSHLRPSAFALSRSSSSSPSSFSTIQSLRHASTFESAPSPPRLPASEQAEFERLQRTANTQEGFNATSTPDFSPQTRPNPQEPSAALSQNAQEDVNTIAPQPNTPLRKGAPPEFEGDVNPRTGEVGGPKNEPLRWGAKGDYSFNGRVTDF
ncbi:hypothetical protein F5Y07DRAFT_366842 [Xylaria sp. FL0933]|nr:hypothetical protein F5Y07DRAFT_366842 [Xylaria sp. FL0933]